MSKAYNVYCDESCHLEGDGQKSMVLGCLVVEKEHVFEISSKIKAIKEHWGLRRFTEIKWTKVSPNKIGMYLDIVDLFLKEERITFRGVIVPDKSILKHDDFAQTNDDFYYKIFYVALNKIINGDEVYKVFFDLKDKYEMRKVRIVKECLVNKYHYQAENIEFQLIHSYESQLIQMADILIGSIGYKARGICTSKAKEGLVSALENGLSRDITATSSLGYSKFNILRWDPKAGEQC